MVTCEHLLSISLHVSFNATLLDHLQISGLGPDDSDYRHKGQSCITVFGSSCSSNFWHLGNNAIRVKYRLYLFIKVTLYIISNIHCLLFMHINIKEKSNLFSNGWRDALITWTDNNSVTHIFKSAKNKNIALQQTSYRRSSTILIILINIGPHE